MEFLPKIYYINPAASYTNLITYFSSTSLIKHKRLELETMNSTWMGFHGKDELVCFNLKKETNREDTIKDIREKET